MSTEKAKERLLAAAERLFEASGYEGVSVRAVNEAAGMNPAAVHYHFGSKEGLVAALLEAKLTPLWHPAVAALMSRMEAGLPLTMHAIASAVLEPLAQLAATPQGAAQLHLLARLSLGLREQPWKGRSYSPETWAQLLRYVRPDLSPEEALDRWELASQLFLQLYGEPLAKGVPGERTRPLPPLSSVVSFITAGLDAPAAPRR